MPKETLQENISLETLFIVAEKHTAKNVGSGARDVLSTPTLVAMIEKACEECLLSHLEENEQSVGVSLDLLHNAPTPLGMKVTINIRLNTIENRTLRFNFIANDEIETIAKGTHVRTIASKRLFDRHLGQKLARLKSKSAS